MIQVIDDYFPAMEEAIATAGRAGSSGNPARPCTGTVIPRRRRKGRAASLLPPGRIVRRRASARSRGAGLAEFADKSPGQVYTILLDRGVYLCSEARMYRLLRQRGQSGERRAQASHPAKKKPELMADGPDQVWSWDITKLKGPARGIWYLRMRHRHLLPESHSLGGLADRERNPRKEFIEHAIEANGGIAPRPSTPTAEPP